MSRPRSDRGQVTVLLVGVLLLLALGALVLGTIARGVDARSRSQRVADLAAVAGGNAMQAAFGRLFEPVVLDGRRNPRHLTREAYLALGRRAALVTARRNGAGRVSVSFPDGRSFAPVRIRVRVLARLDVGARRGADVGALAEAELAPPDGLAGAAPGAGEYRGPLAYRQGKPMRPDVAQAFDRLARAARAAGHVLSITSAFRSNAEQAVLFARNPDPRWVARPGQSLHRLGTELDLGPRSAWGWLAANARRFGFLKRYAWEPWHFGYTGSPGTTSVGYGGRRGSDGRSGGALPSFVPGRFAPAILRASVRRNVSAALLAAQLYAESNFNPYAVSPAGARGIAQFMPATAAAYGLRNPFDATAAIDAQARLMRDLLRQFGSVPLALAAYNAGPAPVQRCGCVPPYPETRAYVARILGLLGGVGEGVPAGGGVRVRLVR